MIPDLEDYLVSPDGRWLLVFSKGPGRRHIAAYDAKGAAMHKVWEQEWNERNNLVMAQWSHGAEAARWSAYVLAHQASRKP